VKFDAVVFLGVGDVEAMHDLGLEREGGSAGVRDPGALESAVMRVQATFGGEPLYPSLALMAAALLAGIARNHPFVDGNKRAAFTASLAFLEVNGFPLTLGDAWIQHVEAAAQGALPLEALAELFAAAMGGFVDVEP
jgi:death-on-curing protein